MALQPRSRIRQGPYWFIIFVLSYALIFTMNILWGNSRHLSDYSLAITQTMMNTAVAVEDTATNDNNNEETTTTPGWNQNNPLAIPVGRAPNLPSIRIENEEEEPDRKFYGGAGDKKHLGGFTDIDIHGISPSVWKHMIQNINVKSLLDVGCGRGISTLWFLKHGVDVLCAEGSHDAIEKSMLPDPDNQVVEHDFSRGPWWPEKTYDAAWSVEFLEHVGVQHHFNYLTAFRKAAILFVSSSRYGGWHHTEVHMDDWWIRKYEAYGFQYNHLLTQEIRKVAADERVTSATTDIVAPNGKHYNAQHIWLTMKVFINPVVAALPEHAHLFFEVGCFQGRNASGIVRRNCGTGRGGELETPLPDDFYPLQITPEMDKEWEEEVKKHIAVENDSR